MTTPEQVDISKLLDKVRKLIAKAQGTDNPLEAQAFQAKADAIMLDYAISEAMIADAKPAAERTKPVVITIELGASDGSGMVNWVASLANRTAQHCRCKIRLWSAYKDGRWLANVYGFESDARYFEVLYTTIQLHMLGVLWPKIDHALSTEDNVYRLRTAGYNWPEIASFLGWKRRYDNSEPDTPYDNTATGETQTARWVVSRIKRHYARALKARGETAISIAARGAEGYRDDAARGYVTRINQRLREAARSATVTGNGAELVLANRAEDLEDFFREQDPSQYTRCPHCTKLSANPFKCDRCGAHLKDMPEAQECERCKHAKSGYCREHAPRAYKERKFNATAYRAGVAHANTADLFGPTMGSAAKREVEG